MPPTLRIRDQEGKISYFLLVDSEGNALNKNILNLVGDRIQVKGEVVKYGDLFVMKGMPERV